VAKATSKTEQSLSTRVIEPIARYLRDTRAELRKVTWPSREEAWNLTLIVLGATVGMSIILYASDLVFSRIMQGIITGNLLWIGIGLLVVIGGVVAIYFAERE
jgi:preprotein translocase subunit SecE